MLDIKPCLWFVAEAEEAANYYVSVFPNSRIAGVMRGAPGSPAIAVDFVLDGKPFLALNGRREPGFTDACSYVVTCETQADIDRYWDALTRGGEESQCGWLKDRYGVSWQVSPTEMQEMMAKGTPEQMARVTKAFLPMKKFDIAKLKEAYEGK